MLKKRNIKIHYGNVNKEITLNERNILEIFDSKEVSALSNLQDELLQNFSDPINSASLIDILNSINPLKIAVIVNDNSRTNIYKYFLQDLINYIEKNTVSECTICFVIACGTHKMMNQTDIRDFFGKHIVDNYSFENHNCRSEDLVEIGHFYDGHPLKINKTVADADLVITTGLINSHYLAGFSGGRKSILPGVSDYESIRKNHSNVLSPNVMLKKINGNPINDQMQEAASMIKNIFNINFVLNQDKKICGIFCGEIQSSHKKGTQFFLDNFSHKIQSNADVVITSPGGIPKDRTFYHTQKCINNVENIVSPEGTIVVFSQCSSGIGSQALEDYFIEFDDLHELLSIPVEKIEVGGHRALATAKILKKVEIILISDLPQQTVESFHFKYASNWEDCLSYLEEKHGDQFSSFIIPNGNFFVAD